MSGATKAFARVRVGAFLKDAGRELIEISIVHHGWTLPDGTQANYLPRDQRGLLMTALEAKRPSADLVRVGILGAQCAEQVSPS